MDQPAGSHCRRRSRASQLWLNAFALIVACCLLLTAAQAQDWVKTGTALGVERVRLAVSEFKSGSAAPQHTAPLKTFNATIWNDPDVSGGVELVSKSFYPLQVPAQPAEVNFIAWNSPP